MHDTSRPICLIPHLHIWLPRRLLGQAGQGQHTPLTCQCVGGGGGGVMHLGANLISIDAYDPSRMSTRLLYS